MKESESLQHLEIKGNINNGFRQWLEYLFGFYSGSVLITNDYDSYIVYQYDVERDALISSYNSFELKNVNKWRIEANEGRYYLFLYDEDLKWASYTMANLDFEKDFSIEILKSNNER